MQLNVDMKATGPLFRRGVPAGVKRAGKRALQELVEIGELRLTDQLRPRPQGVYLSVGQAGRNKASTGNYRRNIHGEVRGDRARIHDSGVVYGPWLEGVGSRNQSTRFKGYATFRKTREWLQGQIGRVMRKHIGKVMRGI